MTRWGGHLLEGRASGFASLSAHNINRSLALGSAVLVQPNVHHLLCRLEHGKLGALGEDLKGAFDLL